MNELSPKQRAARQAYQLGYNDALKNCALVARTAAKLTVDPQREWMAASLANAFEDTAETEFVEKQAQRRQEQSNG